MDRIRERLKRLEAMMKGRTAAASSDDDLEARKLLAFLCHDSEALDLYHQYLESISGTCMHESIGSCVSCWKTRMNSKEAQLALSQFQDRIHALE